MKREREMGVNNKWVKGMTRNGFHKKKAFSVWPVFSSHP